MTLIQKYRTKRAVARAEKKEKKEYWKEKRDTIEDVFGISMTRMRMIEEIVRYDLRPNCKRLGDLLYAVACCADFSEHEKVYAAFKVTQNNSRRGLRRLFHG